MLDVYFKWSIVTVWYFYLSKQYSSTSVQNSFPLIVFIFSTIPNSLFRLARYFLPDLKQSVSVCTFLHVFRLISEYSPLRCRKLHYGPGRKTF